MRPLAADLYRRYREWFATAIRAGLDSGEFSSERDIDALADLAVAWSTGSGSGRWCATPSSTSLAHAPSSPRRSLTSSASTRGAARPRLSGASKVRSVNT